MYGLRKFNQERMKGRTQSDDVQDSNDLKYAEISNFLEQTFK